VRHVGLLPRIMESTVHSHVLDHVPVCIYLRTKAFIISDVPFFDVIFDISKNV